MQNSIYNIKYLLFLSWDWEAWCLTQSGGVVPPPERNTAWNKGRKCFHCLGAPYNLILPWLWHHSQTKHYRDIAHKPRPVVSLATRCTHSYTHTYMNAQRVGKVKCEGWQWSVLCSSIKERRLSDVSLPPYLGLPSSHLECHVELWPVDNWFYVSTEAPWMMGQTAGPVGLSLLPAASVPSILTGLCC